MATNNAFTKRGDTEVILNANADLSGATLTAFAQGGDDTHELITSFVSFSSGVSSLAVQTSELAVGKYKLEVQATLGGKVYTFPDDSFLNLTVIQDLYV